MNRKRKTESKRKRDNALRFLMLTGLEGRRKSDCEEKNKTRRESKRQTSLDKKS